MVKLFLLFLLFKLLKILMKCSKKDSKTTVFVDVFDSPLGKIVSAADEEFLYIVSFEDSKNLEKTFAIVSQGLFCNFVQGLNIVLFKFNREIKEYFEGGLTKFSVPIKTFGSEFQKEVWDKLMEISYGTTQTYGNLAKVMGRPSTHSRAVGAACAANAHVIVVPCHRLVTTHSNGGFSCGINRKQWLIDHEKKIVS